jgi:hypothetical protein
MPAKVSTSSAIPLGTTLARALQLPLERLTMQTVTRWVSPGPTVVGATWLFVIGAAILSYVALTASGVTSALALVLVPSAFVALEGLEPKRQPRPGEH